MRCVYYFKQKIFFLILPFLLTIATACSGGGTPSGDFDNVTLPYRHKSSLPFDYYMGRYKPGFAFDLPEQNIDEPTPESETPVLPTENHTLVTGLITMKPYAGGEFLLAAYHDGSETPISTRKFLYPSYFSLVVPKGDSPLTLKATYTKPNGEQKILTKELGAVEEEVKDIKFNFSEAKNPAQDFIRPDEIVEITP